MFRIAVEYVNGMCVTYDINADDLDDEIDKLCQDDFVLNFTYRRINNDGTLFQY